MVKLNMKSGTPVGNEHLCRRCTWGHFITGYRESDQLVVCRMSDPNFVVPFVVMDCSEFNDRHRPTWEQMKALAINIAPTRLSKSTPGFSTVTKLQPIRRDNDDEDEDADEVAGIR